MSNLFLRQSLSLRVTNMYLLTVETTRSGAVTHTQTHTRTSNTKKKTPKQPNVPYTKRNAFRCVSLRIPPLTKRLSLKNLRSDRSPQPSVQVSTLQKQAVLKGVIGVSARSPNHPLHTVFPCAMLSSIWSWNFPKGVALKETGGARRQRRRGSCHVARVLVLVLVPASTHLHFWSETALAWQTARH